MGYQLEPYDGPADGRADLDSAEGGDASDAASTHDGGGASEASTPHDSGDSLDSSTVSDGGSSSDASFPPDSDAASADADTPSYRPLDWVWIDGGTFQMGSVDGGGQTKTVATFEITRTEVTVGQYLECRDIGVCTPPDTWGAACYWNVAGHEEYPVNCISLRQATDYCVWAGGRLTSAVEWEYAARSGGQDNTYPWGNEPAPTCEYAIMIDESAGGAGCGTNGPHPVCSRPMGNTVHGLCDMAGNVFEWLLHPLEWQRGRGGAYQSTATLLATTQTGVAWGRPNYNNAFIGMRCVRDVP
jgi:formylglycine-generating enzyme required for sulfatase activity